MCFKNAMAGIGSLLSIVASVLILNGLTTVGWISLDYDAVVNDCNTQPYDGKYNHRQYAFYEFGPLKTA
jgi:hypothetical protein